jgi:hypothetical protein
MYEQEKWGYYAPLIINIRNLRMPNHIEELIQ